MILQKAVQIWLVERQVYMSYGKSANKSAQKYKSISQKQIALSYKKDEYEKEILPAIEKSGLPVATYIKLAIAEKILSDERSEMRKVIEEVKRLAVRDITKALRNDCRQIILYGSCARGDFNLDSDVDIAILTDSNREQVKKYSAQIADISAKIGINTTAVVNFICLPYAEFEEKKTWYPFFMNIEKDGVLLFEQ